MLRQTSTCLGRVRLEMLERGFSLVDTPSFLDDGLFRRLKRSKTVLPFHSKRWWKYQQLARYGYWLERLLGQALPEESVSLAALEFRYELAGSEDREVDRLHADGSYIRTAFTPFGPTTVYREGEAERSVPRGQTLLMTALDRARAVHVPCTLHRRPGAGPERAVIVCSFEPRQEELRQVNVVRRVAETSRPRRSDSKGDQSRPRVQAGLSTVLPCPSGNGTWLTSRGSQVRVLPGVLVYGKQPDTGCRAALLRRATARS